MGMEFEVTFKGDHVHVQLNAASRVEDPDLPNDYWGMLRKLCEEYDCRKVLVEGQAPSSEMDPTEVIEAGKRAATVPNLWLAFNLNNHKPNEQSELYEAVAASKGVRVKFFKNSEDALNWLRQNAPA
jgi:hypothetical protein